MSETLKKTHKTVYDWILGEPVQTDNTNYDWVLGVPYILHEVVEEGEYNPVIARRRLLLRF